MTLNVSAGDAIQKFDQANRLYEQGQFAEAAAAYQGLAASGAGTATVFYNLGNAWFKAGQLGRAVAAYRQAEKLEPRDPNIRFNLNFARKQVTGSDAPEPALWQRCLTRLTVNEWAVLASCGLWLWFLSLILREFRPALGRTLRGYTATLGVVAVGLAAALGVAMREQIQAHEAVVVAPQAVVRFGPLEDSKVNYQLRDGSEVVVLDEKRLNPSESWLQVRDASRRVGWLKRDEVIIL
ncbi:MAG: tetratricopeptide repeat protein [Verrucomicrobia subdivision 3 bacterium]|nr:tetratricopeptide repeat protein [Limisphaerales bacterium]